MKITERERKRLKLRQWMDDKKLKSHEVAEKCLYKPQTVRAWACGIKEVPERALRLLKLEG